MDARDLCGEGIASSNSKQVALRPPASVDTVCGFYHSRVTRLKRASELAINIVGLLGFSEAFGLMSVAGVPKELLGPDIQAAVLKEARLMLNTSQATCHCLLRTHREQLDALAARLLEREVLFGDELKALLGCDLTLSTLEA